MKPTMSSTAAGSRITVYFPAGISLGCADSSPFFAAVSASAWALRLATSGELVFCQPEASAASIVMEISEEVCVCHSLRPRELKIPSTDSDDEQLPAAVSLWLVAILTILLTEWARCSGVTAAVCSKCRLGSDCVARAPSPAFGIGSKSESGCCTFASAYDACTTRFKLSRSEERRVGKECRSRGAR